MSAHDRRHFVRGVGALLIAALITGGAKAQGSGLSGAISRARDGLSSLFGGLFDDLFRRYDQAREFVLRRKVLDAAREAPAAEVQRNIADDVRSYLDLFTRFGVSLIPSAAAVPAGKPAEAKANESLQAVIADIVIETLGLGDVQDMLLFLFDHERGSPGPLADIEQAIRAGEYRRAAGFMPALVRRLLADDSQALLAGRFGQARTNALIRGVLISLAEFAVPFLGWGTLAVSFLIALWRNRARLRNASL